MSLLLAWLWLTFGCHVLCQIFASRTVASEKGELFLSILNGMKELMNKSYNENNRKIAKGYIWNSVFESIELSLNQFDLPTQHFDIINMTLNQRPQASSRQIISFCFCASVGLYAVTRNIVRMHRYHQTFRNVMATWEKYRHNFSEIQKIKNSNIKEMAFLEAVFPNFSPNYFQNTQNHSKYKTNVGKFYQELQCDSGFEGSLRHKGKQYPVYFQMKKPSIGFQIAQNALKFDQKGIKFHRNQMIAVYGQLSYSKEAMKYIMKTKLLGLDSVEIVKFTQLKLIATIISTFYFSILLGISINMWLNLEFLNPCLIYVDQLSSKLQKKWS